MKQFVLMDRFVGDLFIAMPVFFLYELEAEIKMEISLLKVNRHGWVIENQDSEKIHWFFSEKFAENFENLGEL